MKALKIFAALAAVLCITLAPLAQARAAEGEITINFNDAELEEVVKVISAVTGKNFILVPELRGKKVTVIGPGKVSPDEAYEVFQAMLGVMGFTIVPAGKVEKIVPLAEAKQTNIETVYSEKAAPGDRMVTKIVQLKYVDATAVATLLNPLTSKNGISTYDPTNILIITDSYSNIQRVLDIIEAIDVETTETTMEIFRLRFAEATSIADIVNQSISDSPTRRTVRRTNPAAAGAAAAAAGTTAKVIADTRINALIVIADPETMGEVKSLINTLDVELPSGKGKINVYQLRYADSESVAAVLNAITQSAGTKQRPGTPQVRTAAAARTGAEDAPVQFEEPVNITADKPTNSLVIVANPQDFETLKAVIEQLDVLRPQVLVEALIVEMQYSATNQLGVEWRTVANPTSDQQNVVGGTNFGNMSSLAGVASNPFSTPAGVFFAAIDGTIELGGQTFPNVAALVTALQTRDDAEILSTPHLLTTDNEEAEIVVSQNIPFKTSTVFDSNGNPRDNYEYRDVGLTLRFTPQINEDDFVRLNLYQETSNVISNTTGSEIAPSTTRRVAKTTVVVKDGATVVIGGLIQDSKSLSSASVPCLGDIPVIGMLFRNQGKGGDKTNLMIFLTPRIIRSPGDLNKITEEKKVEYRELLEEKRRMHDPIRSWEEEPKVSDPFDKMNPESGAGEP